VNGIVVAQIIKQFLPLDFIITLNYHAFLKRQNFGLHFNSVLLGVKIVLLSRNKDVIHQTN
jgi:hypothetical protein